MIQDRQDSEENPFGGTDFEFDLATPLFKQIQECMDRVRAVSLVAGAIIRISDRPGVYMLLWKSTPVYIGKADDSVRSRLTRHRFTLLGRNNLDIRDISFKSVCFAHTWDPFKPEDHLMRHYGTKGKKGWNNKGFGANEPGINRGQTRLKATNFFKRFPLKSDWICRDIAIGSYTALDLLRRIKDDVPFWFKFPGNRVPSSGDNRETQLRAREILEAVTIPVPQAGMTARELLLLIAQTLPGDWQATITPSHMLLDMSTGNIYPEMEIIWPR